MRIRISPDVVIALGLRVKLPGEGMKGRDAELTLTSLPGDMRPPYQRLLTDAITACRSCSPGRTLWRRLGEWSTRYWVTWSRWRRYEPGGWGPASARKLIGRDGPWVDPVLGAPAAGGACMPTAGNVRRRRGR